MPGGFGRAMDGESETPAQTLRLKARDLAGKAFFFGSVLPAGYPLGLWRLPKEMNSAFGPKAFDLLGFVAVEKTTDHRAEASA
ncbi:MAG: hypothetical protein H0W24_00325 [Lysobacter sp.]|nr:hypothetical protein [Lysobacter sp.]